jgi:ABC-type transport system involved in multi-copper enzyme maturation permease subunit
LNIEFPLLKRQAIQLSQRRRLWIVRTLLMLAQLTTVLPTYTALMSRSTLSVLGRGSEIFAALLTCNLVLIYLLQPFASCSMIASERERQTLPLLLISRISPAWLVWEKFLWSLQPVMSSIAVSLPVMAISYALGGLSGIQLATGTFVLLLAALQVNSVGIFWSTVYGTPLQAFWATLLTLLLMLLGPPVLGVAGIWPFDSQILGFLPADQPFSAFWTLVYPNFAGQGLFSGPALGIAAVLVLPPLGASLVLLLASGYMVSRFRCEAPATLLKRAIRNALTRSTVDAVPVQSVQRVHSGPVGEVVKSARPTDRSERAAPARFAMFSDRPLAARECRASVTARPIAHVILAVLLALLVWLMMNSFQARAFECSVVLQMCTLFLGVLQVQSLASRSIGAERDRETLAVLLTVPISSAEIVSQKLAAASSFRNLLMLPLGVLLLISLFFGTTFLGLWDDGMYSSMGRREKFDQFGSLWGAPISHLLLLVIYWQHLTLALRVGAICSLITRTTLRSAALSFSILVGYCVLHTFLLMFLAIGRGSFEGLIPVMPLAGLACILSDRLPVDDGYGSVGYLSFFSGLAMMGLLLTVLRVITAWKAAEWLQRADEEKSLPDMLFSRYLPDSRPR